MVVVAAGILSNVTVGTSAFAVDLARHDEPVHEHNVLADKIGSFVAKSVAIAHAIATKYLAFWWKLVFSRNGHHYHPIYHQALFIMFWHGRCRRRRFHEEEEVVMAVSL